MGRQAGIDVETVLWTTLLVGLVVARLGFVWEFRSAYFGSPLEILDVRDGGWSPTAGFVGAWLFALSRPVSCMPPCISFIMDMPPCMAYMWSAIKACRSVAVLASIIFWCMSCMVFMRGSIDAMGIGAPMPVMAGVGGGEVFMPPGPAQAEASVVADTAMSVRSAVMDNA